jgi:hypothetical protein
MRIANDQYTRWHCSTAIPTNRDILGVREPEWSVKFTVSD